MKHFFDMSAVLNAYNSLLSGWVLLLTGLFGTYWYLFAALLLFNVLDWITGWYKARKLQQESSKIGLQGLIKKLLYWVLLAVAFTVAAVFGRFGLDLAVNEARSITENLLQIGVAVPAVLTNGLQVAADVLAQGSDKGGKQ